MKTPVLATILACLLLSGLVSAPVLGTTNETGSQVEQPGGELLRPVSYITLRNKTGETEPKNRFGDERNSIHTGQCTFSHVSLSLLSPLSRNGLVYIPENLIQLEAVSDVGEMIFWDEIKAATQGQRPLLYLHGYNTSFVKSCEQAALFQANLNLGSRLILFSWPSDGAILNYARDESDLLWSVAPLERVLGDMVEQFGAGGFDVVAHSLGTRGVFLALVQLARRHHESIPLINQLVLTAPDIDAGIFQQYLAAIRPLTHKFSLYVSENDKPLVLSEEVHGYPRLGQPGPHLDDLDGIEIIDISDVGIRSFSGHLYHLYHDSVMQDLDLLLNHGAPASERETLAASTKGDWRLKQADGAQ
ncbi:MAG: alpha/beta hydrolase [Proteobacteria bacterium]|nr:alpha/beta hydrolase [Pseudomonadota bacterium]